MLLFEISNGQQSAKQLSDYEKCVNNDTNALKVRNICVPSNDTYPSSIQMDGPQPFKRQLKIEIKNLQVIEIESHAISLSMEIFVAWYENRLILNVPLMQTIFLIKEAQGKIWSPKLLIANNKMLENKEREEFGFTKFNDYEAGGWGTKTFYLYTKVRCAMEFENFPFDKHVCILEVSKRPFFILAYKTLFII